jgi:hypothetical protein
MAEELITEVHIKLSKPQFAVYKARKDRILSMAGQGGGKSGMIGFLSGIFVQHYPQVKGFIAANTYQQLSQSTLVQCTKFWGKYFNLTRYDAKTGQGDYVMDKQPPGAFTRFHEFKSYGGIISFRNGAVIFVGSLDNYLAHDGKEFGWAHLDETKDSKEAALKDVILARIRQEGIWIDPNDPDPTTNLHYDPEKKPDPTYKPFNPCYIHTSPSEGTVEWLNRMFNLDEWEHEILDRIVSETDFFYRERNHQAVCIYSTYHNQANLPESYIPNKILDLTEAQQLKFIYGYPFSKTGGEYFPSFDRIHSVRECPLILGAPIHCSLDFNVMPYMTLIAMQIHEDIISQEYELRIFREYCLSSPLNSTTAVCEAFLRDYQHYITDLFYYGDASGRSRIPGKGNATNYDDLRAAWDYYLAHGSDRVSIKNKGVLKRRDFLERIFQGKVHINGKKVRIYIDPECKEMIKDLQYLKLGAEGKHKEEVKNADGAKYQKLGHTSDALEYMICEILDDLM